MTKQSTLVPINANAVDLARAGIPTDPLLTTIVELFQALGDPTRARILYALIQGPLCVRDLAILAGVSESAMSHQLRLLRGLRIVQPRHEKNVVHYSLNDHHTAALFREAEYHADHVQRELPNHPYHLP